MRVDVHVQQTYDISAIALASVGSRGVALVSGSAAGKGLSCEQRDDESGDCVELHCWCLLDMYFEIRSKL